MAKILISCLAAVVLLISCETSSRVIDYMEVGQFTMASSDMINVIWHLEKFNIGDRRAAAGDLEPFTFIIGDSTVGGFDGCNWYGGRYELTAQEIQINALSSTEIACDLEVFSVAGLQGNFLIELSANELVLTKSDLVLKFSSNTPNTVQGSPLIGKTWQVTESNAPEFDVLKTQDFLPRFEFDENRRFRAEWYCSNDNIFECNEQSGLYGLGDNQVILFWKQGISYTVPNGLKKNEDQLFIERILKSESYSINDAALTLYNDSEQLFFEFSAQ